MRSKLPPTLRGSCLFALLAVAVQPASAQDDLAVNRLLASQCAQCHGTNGYALGEYDGLAGDEDIDEDLMDMKGEDRPENIMDHQALGYTDDQIRRIASYYATLPEQESGADGDKEEDEYAEAGEYREEEHEDEEHEEEEDEEEEQEEDEDEEEDEE